MEFLNLDEVTLYKQDVCGYHFLITVFTSSTCHRLKQSSIPQPYYGKEEDDLHGIPPLHTYSNSPVIETPLSPKTSTSFANLDFYTTTKTPTEKISTQTSETKQLISDELK